MIVTIKKRTLITATALALAALAVIIAVCAAARAPARASKPLKTASVVIDAGHGGIDRGVSGVTTKVAESDLNLAVARKLTAFFLDYGVQVTLTRDSSDGLYGMASSDATRKMRDMTRRRDVIDGARPDLMISIHMNSYPQASQRGAQVFHSGGADSVAAANGVRTMLAANLEYSNRPALKGDYYILNCTAYPSVLVECGFLSNADDERLLIDGAYQERVAYYIFCGAALFLDGVR
jgi:N-acetylmuramoyl-L-alanine amidase